MCIVLTVDNRIEAMCIKSELFDRQVRTKEGMMK